jgi:hypothetical protein
MATCTIFKNYAVPVENRALLLLANDIASDKYKAQVQHIQNLIAQGNEEEAKKFKVQLPAFTPSATYTEKRLATHIDQYSGFVHLDFDKLTTEQMQQAFETIAQIPYTFLCFRSPSGNGLKVFVEVDTTAEYHAEAYRQVQTYYETQTELTSDAKCKDITRLCFVSYDPTLYKNISNQKFKVDTGQPVIKQPEVKQQAKPLVMHTGYEQLLEECVRFTEQKKTYTEGSRNEFVYVFASNCNRKGIPDDIALQYALHTYDLPEQEIKAAFGSAYKHHTAEFAKFANTAKLQSLPEVIQQPQPITSTSTPAEPPTNEEDYLKATPAIHETLYAAMPDIIKDGAMAFPDHRERDVFLTGALAILSGCIPNVKGLYAMEEVFPNLFSFTVAPAASGKGALKFAKMLADDYHNAMLTASRNNEVLYNQQTAEYKQRIATKKKNDPIEEEPPVKPPFKVVYIPANCSYAKILSHLEQNEGTGIICETEADTLGNIFKQDWGSYSDMLRKSFHHERISSSRKTNNEFIEVNNPCLSIALSGTPNQVTGLIASAEDGLFSRFVFYAYKIQVLDWKDVSPYVSNINLTEHFKTLAAKVYSMVQFLETSPTEVQLTREQWQALNSTFREMLLHTAAFTAEEAASIVKRLGLIQYRIAMLFTAMRKFENGEAEQIVICTDEDFTTAMQLVKIYLQHSLLMFNNLPKQGEATQFKTGDNKRKCFEALPQTFTRQQAVTIGSQFSLSARTVDDLLKSLVPQYLSKPKAGTYQKV